MSFTLINRCVNPAVRALLRSPLHPLLSKRLMLISVTGRRSGEVHTFPVGYTANPTNVIVGVGAPSQKVWWRNLEAPSDVELLIKGESRRGSGRAIETDAGVTVEIELFDPAATPDPADAPARPPGPAPRAVG